MSRRYADKLACPSMGSFVKFLLHLYLARFEFHYACFIPVCHTEEQPVLPFMDVQAVVRLVGRAMNQATCRTLSISGSSERQAVKHVKVPPGQNRKIYLWCEMLGPTPAGRDFVSRTGPPGETSATCALRQPVRRNCRFQRRPFSTACSATGKAPESSRRSVLSLAAGQAALASVPLLGLSAPDSGAFQPQSPPGLQSDVPVLPLAPDLQISRVRIGSTLQGAIKPMMSR